MYLLLYWPRLKRSYQYIVEFQWRTAKDFFIKLKYWVFFFKSGFFYLIKKKYTNLILRLRFISKLYIILNQRGQHSPLTWVGYVDRVGLKTAMKTEDCRILVLSCVCCKCMLLWISFSFKNMYLYLVMLIFW